MKRIFYWIWIACIAAACGGTACSREEAVVPAEGGEELSDKPLVIRANIEGLLESRGTVASGLLRGQKWCLSLMLNEYGGGIGTRGAQQDYLIADFSKGYGEFEWHGTDINTIVPYELTWNKIMNSGDNKEVTMSLDNAPVYWDNITIAERTQGVGLYHDVDIGWYSYEDDRRENTYLMPFYTEEEARKFHPEDYSRFRGADGKFDRERYRAQLEPEGDEIAPNDLLLGYWLGNGDNARNKLYVDISVKHIMSRVHVEITSPDIPDLDRKQVRVWIDHLASECYGIIRMWHPQMILSWCWPSLGHIYPSAIIYPFRLSTKPANDGKWWESWNLMRNTQGKDPDGYTYDGRDETIYSNTLYLLGDKNETEKLLPVTDETGAEKLRTHYLIMPPQSTNFGTALAPRLHLEIDGTRYSCNLPSVITEGGTGQISTFAEFKENQDITLSVRVSNEPPEIEFSALVKNWVDKGTWALETKRGGIYERDDLIKAVQAFNAYVAEQTNEKLEHAVERYGYFTVKEGKDKDIFTFVFFTDLEGEYPAPPIAEAGAERFDVEMNGHEIYGCSGKANPGQVPADKDKLKQKMQGK